ncbi:MAG: 50S ribosomal protein L18 [Candidatus Liptonbacteria bacterium]|nr:50S ribosomal protein L18 [Candidatus Liptonbacteria bacterium]
MITKHLNQLRLRRAKRTRSKIRGTAARPRLSILRSNKFIYAQLIDDVLGKTLVHASSLKLRKGKEASKLTKIGDAEQIGSEIAKKAGKLGIKAAVFDRGRYKFHGRVMALCESARKAGLRI